MEKRHRNQANTKRYHKRAGTGPLKCRTGTGERFAEGEMASRQIRWTPEITRTGVKF